MLKISQEEEFTVLRPEVSSFDDDFLAGMEKKIIELYTKNGIINYILDLDGAGSLNPDAVVLFDKLNQIIQREEGVFVVIINNDDMMDILADHSKYDNMMVSSLEEAAEYIYMNLEGDEFEGEDDDFFDDNDY